MDPLTAITPIDGRYRESLEEVSKYFSEYALMKYRLKIELTYLKKLLKTVKPQFLKTLPQDWEEKIEKIWENFSLSEARRVKEIEEKVGHDLVALIEYLEEKLKEMSLGELTRFVHLGLTSEDINNLAYSMLLRDFVHGVYLPSLAEFLEALISFSEMHRETVMLARTHGQPAVPTTFGRMLAGYTYRIARIAVQIKRFSFPGKLGGAVGDHAALHHLYPSHDWLKFSREFVEELGLEFWPAPTQILPHDKLSELFSNISILNAVLSNLSRDLWILSMLNLVRFRRERGELHSSTMPHKSNPLWVENAEGCLDLASHLFAYLSLRLITSRLHRDLSDSPIKRFYGAPFALSLNGIKNLKKALKNMEVLKENMRKELENHPEAITEAFYVNLKKAGIKNARRKIAETTIEELMSMMKDMNISESDKKSLMELKPWRYVGEAPRNTTLLIAEARKMLKIIKK